MYNQTGFPVNDRRINLPQADKPFAPQHEGIIANHEYASYIAANPDVIISAINGEELPRPWISPTSLHANDRQYEAATARLTKVITNGAATAEAEPGSGPIIIEPAYNIDDAMDSIEALAKSESPVLNYIALQSLHAILENLNERMKFGGLNVVFTPEQLIRMQSYVTRVADIRIRGEFDYQSDQPLHQFSKEWIASYQMVGLPILERLRLFANEQALEGHHEYGSVQADLQETIHAGMNTLLSEKMVFGEGDNAESNSITNRLTYILGAIGMINPFTLASYTELINNTLRLPQKVYVLYNSLCGRQTSVGAWRHILSTRYNMASITQSAGFDRLAVILTAVSIYDKGTKKYHGLNWIEDATYLGQLKED